jgi:hypothetical protein
LLVLLFSQALQSLRDAFPAQTAPPLQQWLAAVLLGAITFALGRAILVYVLRRMRTTGELATA